MDCTTKAESQEQRRRQKKRDKFRKLFCGLISREWGLSTAVPSDLVDLLSDFFSFVYSGRFRRDHPYLTVSTDGLTAQNDGVSSPALVGRCIALDTPVSKGELLVIDFEYYYERADGVQTSNNLGTCYFSGVLSEENVLAPAKWEHSPWHKPASFPGAFGLDDSGEYYAGGRHTPTGWQRFRQCEKVRMSVDLTDSSHPFLQFDWRKQSQKVQLPTEVDAWYPTFTPYNVGVKCTIVIVDSL